MIHSVKGVEDLFPPKTDYYNFVEKEARRIFSLYGYREIRIPTFERTELFIRSVGQETDVGKQMYTFTDKGGRSISLRPEGTAGVVRAYLQHKIYGKGKEWKVYYMGPMFRYERPQAGRLREFYQIGVECFGVDVPWIDVELVEMAYSFFQNIGLKNLEIQINSLGCKKCRSEYVRALKVYLGDNLNSLCEVCQRRYNTNTLRLLDCKNEICRKTIEKAPKIGDFICSSCFEHFNQVLKQLDRLNIAYKVNPYLVRGLDYYTRTIFEIVSPHLGSQNTVCAGGRYDDLVAELGGPPIPALGFAMGVERLVISLNKAGIDILPDRKPAVFVVTIGKDSIEEGLKIARLIRSQNIQARVNLMEKSLSSQLKEADKEGFSWVLIIGEDELKRKKFPLKDMKSGHQVEISIGDISNLNEYLMKRTG